MRYALMLVLASCTLPLGGCVATGGGINSLINELNTTSAQILGAYQAPTLAAFPTPSGCANNDQRCVILDQTELTLYTKARSRSISWRQVVEQFYSERQRLFPNTNDSLGASEILAYQRVLADQMDGGKITETEWVYLIDQKWREIQTRGQINAASSAIVRQQQQLPSPSDTPKNCWTTRSGNSYYTTCN